MYIFIVNPMAGNGRGKRVCAKIKKSKLYREIDHTFYYTKYPGHAEEIAHQITVNGHHVTSIIVVGGDGTLHEVMNGLGDVSIPVSFIPGGSGNDFARGCLIKGKTVKILNSIIQNKQEKSYWLGNYQINNNSQRHFVNNMGFGFDAEITRIANGSKYKRLLNAFRMGKFIYIIALIQVLLRFKPRETTIEIDGNRRVIKDCWMVTITNHPFYGGGMKIIPEVMIQPTVFSVLILHSISRWKVLGMFMTVFTGKHVHFKEVELLEATNLKIFTKNRMSFQVDGQTSTCTSCTISKQLQAIGIMGTKHMEGTGA